jgi:hypothetical protein
MNNATRTKLVVNVFVIVGIPLSGQELPLFPSDLRTSSAVTEQKNVLRYGINLITNYEADVAGTTLRESHRLHSVEPHVAWQILQRRWESTCDYFAAFSRSSPPVSDYDIMSHALGLTFKYRFSKRLTGEVHNNFTRTSNPFDQVTATSSLPSFGILESPNSSSPRTSNSRRTEQLGINLSYRLDARSMVVIGGSFTQLDYEQPEARPGFDPQLRSMSETSNAFYARQLGTHSATGVGYSFQRLDFGHGDVKTTGHTLLYFWNQGFSRGVMVSLFAGPEYSRTWNQQPDVASGSAAISQWSWAGGSTLAWKTIHNELIGSAVQRISDGGGVSGNVRLVSLGMQGKRLISAGFGINIFLNYNRNRLLSTAADSRRSFDYLSGGAGIDRKLTQHSWLGLFYQRVNQNGSSRSANIGSGNRVGIRLSYGNERPIGRP